MKRLFYLFILLFNLCFFQSGKSQTEIELLEQKVDIFLSKKEYHSALEMLSLIIELDPKNSDAYNNKGAIIARLGDTLEALNYTNLAIQYNSKNIEAYTNKAIFEYNLKNYESSLLAIEKAMDLGRKDSESFVLRACAKGALHNYESSLNDFDKAIQLNPNSDTLYVQKAQMVQYEFSDPDKSIAILNEGLKKFPQSRFALEMRVVYNIKKENEDGYKNIINDINQLLKIAPESSHPNYYYARGMAKSKLDDMDGACEDMNEARLLGLGDAFLFMRDNCTDKITDDAFKADLLAYEADLSCQNGNYEKAILNLSKAIKIMPDKYSFYYQRARNNYMIKQYSDVIEDLTISLKLKPNDSWSLALYGQCLMMIEDLKVESDFTLAKEYLKNAIKSDPNQAEFYYHLSLLCMDTKDFTNAELYLLEIIKLVPNESEPYLILGDNYLLLNNKEKACVYFNYSKNLGNEEAKKRIIINCNK